MQRRPYPLGAPLRVERGGGRDPMGQLLIEAAARGVEVRVLVWRTALPVAATQGFYSTCYSAWSLGYHQQQLHRGALPFGLRGRQHHFGHRPAGLPGQQRGHATSWKAGPRP